MRRNSTIFLLLGALTSVSFAQQTNHKEIAKYTAPASIVREQAGASTKAETGNTNVPYSKFSPLVSVTGAYDMNLTNRYHGPQTTNGELHNIQADPDNPLHLHAVVMGSFTTSPGDTLSSNFYPKRNIFYTYSDDGGQTWKAKKQLAALRAGFPDMQLYKRNGVYVPVIGAHRYESEGSSKFISTLFVEKGNPGDGNFEETPCDMTSADGNGDVEILWPSIAVSPDNTKVYMVASSNLQTGSTADDILHLQFSTFTLDGTGHATWSGWKKGPAYEDAFGLCTGGHYVVRTAASGKVGVVWQSYDFNTPDRGLYIAESNDNGTTWGNADVVYSPVASQDGSSTFDPSNGADFFYDNAGTPHVIFSCYYELGTFSANTYTPSSGSLFYWTKGKSARYLLGFRDDNDLGASEKDGSWLSDWTNNLGIDPGGANIENPTIALTADANVWSVFFEGWQQDDIGSYDYIDETSSSATISYPFHGLYRMETKDGGQTFSDPIPFRVNDITAAQETRLDYRFPQVSTVNPTVQGNVNFAVMYVVDSIAGDLPRNGLPGWDDNIWYFQPFVINGVTANQATPVSILGQNYPNPVVSSTTIPVALTNDGPVTITIGDLLGREVKTVFAGQLTSGNHSIPTKNLGLAPGVYRYTIKTATQTESRLMTIVQ